MEAPARGGGTKGKTLNQQCIGLLGLDFTSKLITKSKTNEI